MVMPSVLDRLDKLLRRRPEGEPVELTSTPLSLTSNVRVAWNGRPFMITLGRVELEVHPDLRLDGEERSGVREWIVRPHSDMGDGLPKFIRIKANVSTILGSHDEIQASLFSFDRSVAHRHVLIDNRAGDLIIQPLDTDRSTIAAAIDSPPVLWSTRRERLRRLPSILGRPVAPYDDDGEALEALRRVNEIVKDEAYRDVDDDGAAGGVIRFPDDRSVLVMGDVHARVDNVLRVISESDVLGALERDEVCLVFLGDLLHSEARGELEDMTSSVLALDLFIALKLRFPKNVFYIHGNHESFSADVSKGGVPQGLLFRKHLKKRRGKAFITEVEILFDNLAYVVQGKGFAACHGAPVRSTVDRRTLVNIRRYPGLQHEIVWNRLRQSSRPAGYGKGSVKRFRRTLSLPKHAPLIVAHTPLSKDDTIWMDVGDIRGHHIVYSAHTDRLAVFAASGGEIWPLELVPDAAMAWLDDQPENMPRSVK